MNIEAIKTHIETLSADTRADILAGRWDEVMTDRLYSACGAETAEEMRAARESAVSLCNEALAAASNLPAHFVNMIRDGDGISRPLSRAIRVF